MNKSTAVMVVLGCLFITWFAWYTYDDMAKQIEDHYNEKLVKITIERDSLLRVCDSLKNQTIGGQSIKP